MHIHPVQVHFRLINISTAFFFFQLSIWSVVYTRTRYYITTINGNITNSTIVIFTIFLFFSAVYLIGTLLVSYRHNGVAFRYFSHINNITYTQ